MSRCDFCNRTLTEWDTCDACDLYNAAVAAQKAAAQSVALSFDDGATDAWLNQYGVFAWVDGVTMQVGTPEQAAPFVALTGQSRRVTAFWRARTMSDTPTSHPPDEHEKSPRNKG